MVPGKPDSVFEVIYLSSLPGGIRRATFKASLLGIAPGGGYRACQLTLTAGGLLPHRFTCTCLDRFYGFYSLQTPIETGSLFSVALSVGLPLPAFWQLLALWSPDFPPFIEGRPHRNHRRGYYINIVRFFKNLKISDYIVVGIPLGRFKSSLLYYLSHFFRFWCCHFPSC